MKKIITAILIALLSITTFAQKDVTKFLGIPVDGTKAEMIRKLKAKGFQEMPYSDGVLEGEFNGKTVNIYIATNSNKVWRIMIVDKYSIDKENIISRYNQLLSQFENKPSKYTKIIGDKFTFTSLDFHEKIFNYYISNNKFTAGFIQESEQSVFDKIKPKLLKKYTIDQINNPDAITYADIHIETLYYSESATKLVWFKIDEEHDGYKIVMFYDNTLNEANGEDL